MQSVLLGETCETAIFVDQNGQISAIPYGSTHT